ncbi:MAG TPA: hypothetical protein VES20_24220 [Bryobacteraceae bacterium]|nr:hypothetical protein [Bryobacteraceae bacterium]
MDNRLAATVAGAAATVPMTAVMVALHKILPGEPDSPLPPREITEHAAEAVGAEEAMDELGEGGRQATTLAAHFSYGAAAGVAYLPFSGKSGMPPALEGAAFGMGVWGASYLGLMPATGLYRSATKEATARNVLMIAAHVVWGAALGQLYHELSKRFADQSS